MWLINAGTQIGVEIILVNVRNQFSGGISFIDIDRALSPSLYIYFFNDSSNKWIGRSRGRPYSSGSCFSCWNRKSFGPLVSRRLWCIDMGQVWIIAHPDFSMLMLPFLLTSFHYLNAIPIVSKNNESCSKEKMQNILIVWDNIKILKLKDNF